VRCCNGDSGASDHMVLLDAARSVAALAVVCWHWQHFWNLDTSAWSRNIDLMPFHQLLYPLYLGGWLAVDFFFMLSGFVMCLVYRERISAGSLSFSKYMFYRFSRLYPLHLVTLLFIALIQSIWIVAKGNLLLFPVSQPDYYDINHFVLQIFFASQWGLQKGPSFNDPVWSVSIEILLYMMFYVTMRRWGRSALLWAGLSACGYALFALNIVNGLGRGIFCFFLGCLLHRFWVSYQNRPDRHRYEVAIAAALGVGVILGLAAWATGANSKLPAWLATHAAATIHHPDLQSKLAERLSRLFVYNAVVIAVYPAALLVLANIEPALKGIAKPLAKLGNISYSSYLLHFPLQLVCMMVFGAATMQSVGYSGEAVFALFFAVLLALSFASHAYLEIPVQRWLRARFARQALSAR